MAKLKNKVAANSSATKSSFAMLSPLFDLQIAAKDTLLAREIVMLFLTPTNELCNAFDLSGPAPGFYIPPQLKTGGLSRLIEKMLSKIPPSKAYDKDYIALIAPHDAIARIKHELEDALTVPRALIFFPYPIVPGRSAKHFVLNQIYKAIGLRDLFGKSGHITSRQDLFGRQRELNQITNAIQEGRNVGIFGLRKIGKTSLLLAVGANIHDLNMGRMLRFDLDNPAITRLRWWEMLERIAQLISQDRMLGPFTEDKASRSFELTVGAWLRAHPQTRLVIAFDEIESITPDTSPHDEWASDYYHLFSSLRSNSRQFDKFNFIVCGINSRSVEAAQLGNYDNPIFNGVQLIYVPMFTLEQCKQMAHRLGSQLMITFEDEAITALYEEFGGHPYLFRQACAHIVRKAQEHSYELPFRIDVELVLETKAAREQEMVEYCNYIFSHLNHCYSDELELLSMLSRDESAEFNEWETLLPNSAHHLRR